MKELEKGIRFRIRLIGVVFTLCFVLVAIRAFDLQVLQEQQWDERAERQHQKVIPLTPQRGTIFDRNGEELAVSVDVDSVYAEPGKLKNWTGAATTLFEVKTPAHAAGVSDTINPRSSCPFFFNPAETPANRKPLTFNCSLLFIFIILQG